MMLAPLSSLLRRHLLFVVALWIMCLGGACAPAPSTTPDAAAKKSEPASERPGALAAGEPATALSVEADDGTWGNSQAPVTLVAFLDLECPFCARGFRTLNVLKEEYGPERLRLVIKHLPLEFHPSALPAAVAAQAVRNAAGNEAFFQYVELLLARPRALDPSSLADAAEEVGLERAIYNEHVASEATFQAVVNDVELAQRLGITGTPAFYINGRALRGAQPVDAFRELIDAESRIVTARLEQGADFASVYAQRVKENLHTSIGEELLARDPTTYSALVDGSPVRGNPDAPVTLVEFSDFECPFCKKIRPTISKLEEKYGSNLRVVFKHLPLDFHNRAKPAARLADAIYQERGADAFWQAVDRLFSAAPNLSDEALVRIGTDLGLAEERAVAAVRGKQSSDRVERDINLASDLNARGTPHFFVNGRRITGAQPLAHFELFIDAALAEAKQRMAKGLAPGQVYDELMRGAAMPGAPERLDPELTRPLAAAQRPSRGPATAPVVIRVFSDFQCPFCRKAEMTLAALEERYPNRIRVVWHNLPLPFHEQARPAARAAEEAFAQGGNGAFWKMHGSLFNLNGDDVAVSPEDLVSHARRGGLDVTRFRKALEEGTHEESVIADEDFAERLGIQGTPTFLVGDYLVKGAVPIDEFERVIERVLEERGQH